LSFLGKVQTCVREVFVLAVLRCLQDEAIEVLKPWGGYVETAIGKTLRRMLWALGLQVAKLL
jgi:hypothetical protein